MQLHKKRIILVNLALVVFCTIVQSVHAEGLKNKDSSTASNVWTADEVQHLIAQIEWASQQEEYSGQYVISQADAMNTLETMHTVIDGKTHELTTTLNGDEITIYRDDEDLYSINNARQSILFDPQTMVQLFPSWGKPGYGDSQSYYKLETLASERYIGRDAEVIQILPKDDWRFGYKVWVDRRTGLLLRLEVHDDNGKTLQRLFFTEIKIENVKESEKIKFLNYISTLKEQGFQINKWPFTYASAIDEGWELPNHVNGFVPIACVKRPLEMDMQELIQCVFTDGVAGVSIFIEPLTKDRFVLSTILPTSGATNGIVYGLEQWKVTIVGEVPVKTLENFATLLQKANESQESNKK